MYQLIETLSKLFRKKETVMSALYTSPEGNFLRASYNLLLNSSVAYCAAHCVREPDTRDVYIIVAIDTLFRFAITHALSKMNLPYLQIGVAGHLIFPCLTLLAQPLSVLIARKVFNTHRKWESRLYFMVVFGYISLGWKLNMMSKDVIYMNLPTLKKA